MAGDALRDANFAARTKLSEDPEKAAERAAKATAEGYDVSGYSDKEISMALQGDSFLEDDYFRLTGKRPGQSDAEPDTPAPAPTPVEEVPVAAPAPEVTFNSGAGNQSIGAVAPMAEPIGEVGISAGQYQAVNQDNDINTSIAGDGNVTEINQDNSVSQGAGSRYLADWMQNHNFFN